MRAEGLNGSRGGLTRAGGLPPIGLFLFIFVFIFVFVFVFVFLYVFEEEQCGFGG